MAVALAAPAELELEPPLPPEAPVVPVPAAAVAAVGMAMVVLGIGTPEVKGTMDAEVAPENAGAAAVAEGFGIMEVALGLRTLAKATY